MLGAGKTSLIVAAARRLVEQGRRVGVVTNDQGSGLVDTALVRAAHVPVAEVPGGCFCCRLSDLLRACDALAAERPEVIFAEPVGSCVDLAATVLGRCFVTSRAASASRRSRCWWIPRARAR